MLYSALSEFPILAIAALGFYISLRFLRFPDMTVDASYMFGMAILGFSIKHHAPNEFAVLIVVPLFGAAVGAITGLLHTSRHLSMNKFLSGMIVAFASYSICYRLVGQADLSLYQFRDALLTFQLFENFPRYAEPLALFFVSALVWFLVQRLLNTPFGLAVRTAGHRPDVLRVSGLSPNATVILGLAFSNAIIAIAGWLDATVNRNVSLKNFGTIVNVLAACLIGDFIRYGIVQLFPRRLYKLRNSTMLLLLSPLVGALAYSILKSFVIQVLSGQLTMTLTTDFQFIVALCIVFTTLAAKKIQAAGMGDDDSEV